MGQSSPGGPGIKVVSFHDMHSENGFVCRLSLEEKHNAFMCTRRRFMCTRRRFICMQMNLRLHANELTSRAHEPRSRAHERIVLLL